MQTWAQNVAAAGVIPTDAAGASALLDLLGSTEGEMLRRGPDGWLTFTSPGGTTMFLRADGTWAVPAGGGGGGTLASLTDVDIPSPADGDALTYDAATSKWVAGSPVAPALSALWRIRYVTNFGDPNDALQRVQMMDTVGGTNLVTNTANISALDHGSFGGNVVNLVAGASPYWIGSPNPQWIEYNFGTPINVEQVILTPYNSASFVNAFVVEYFDGTSWIIYWGATGATATAGVAQTFINQAGRSVQTHTASYTLALADDGTYQRMKSASVIGLTVPANAAVAFPIGTEIRGSQQGSGELTVVPDTGVTFNTMPPPVTPYGQGEDFTLIKVDTDEWDVLGHANIPAVTAFKKWRINVTVNNGDPNVALNYFEMATTHGGANIATVGANVSAQSTIFGSPTTLAGPPGSVWVSNGKPVWIEYDFPTAQTITELRMNCFSTVASFPRDFTVQYFDPASSTWVVAATFTGASGTGGVNSIFSW